MPLCIAKVADCFTPLTTATAKALRDAGYTGVARYLGKLTHNWAKGITLEEVSIILAAGLKLILIWEGSPTQAAYFSSEQGLQDPGDALKELAWLGLPDGGTVYFTVDYDAVTQDFPDIEAYFTAVQQVISNVVQEGAYGDFSVLTDLHGSAVPPKRYWQTAGMSKGQVASCIHMYQDQFGVTVGGLQIDVDEVYQNPGWWPITEGSLNMSEPLLRLGATGDAVKLLQTKLNAHGAKLVVDGDFGPRTNAAVLAFQKTHGLTQDGIVGPHVG